MFAILQNLLRFVATLVVHLFLSPLMLLDFVHDLPTILLHHKKIWFEFMAAFVILGSMRILLSYKYETKKLKEINAKLAIDHEFNIARKTIRFNRPPLDTYGEDVVVKGIHIIGKKFDMAINGMEIAGGHSDGRHRARVRGAEEWITFGSQLVINMNDITEEVVKSGGNVDLEWTLAPREL